MSWTATLLAGQRDTGRRIFIEPERREVAEPPYVDFGYGVQVVAGRPRRLVRSESFRGNYVYTFRETADPLPPPPPPPCPRCMGSESDRYGEIIARPAPVKDHFREWLEARQGHAIEMLSDLVEDRIMRGHTCPACKPRATFESFL